MKFNKKILKNGLTVLHEKRDVPVTTVMLAVKYGAAYESEENKGISHFMEHLCFKGTEKRTVDEIVHEIEGVGGILNAFTHEEITAYHAKLPSEHFETAIDVIFDVFFNASFPESEVEKEGNAIIEEIKMYHDDPHSRVLEGLKQNLYEKPFGMFIPGSAENIRRIKRKQLFELHRKVYTPKNSILSVVGNNSFEEVIRLAEKFSVDREGFKSEIPEIKHLVLNGSEKRKDLHQTNIALGVHLPFSSKKDKHAAEVFSTILGSGMSSKLFKEVREKRGLVYGIRSEGDIGNSYGYLVIWAGTDPEKVEEVKRISLDEYSKMKKITEEELEAAKKRIIGGRHVVSEDSNHVAVNLVFEELSGDAKDYYNFEEEIKQVSLKDIKKIAEKSNFASFELGP